MYDSMKMLTEEQKHRIHELACRILNETGMNFELEEAQDIFKANGFKVNGKHVLITPRQVEEALKTLPREFDVIAPDKNKVIHVGGESKVYSSSCSSTRIQDLDGTVRFAEGRDYEQTLKLIQGMDIITNCFEFVVPQDVPQENYLMFNLYAQMHTIDKPLSCQFVDAIPMLAIYYGTTVDQMRESAKNGLAYGLSYVNPLSPLAMSDYEARKLIHFSRSGLATAVAPFSICGLTAPCTLEGLIVQQCAEILGGLVLSQLVSPGAPMMYGCLGTITNMRNMLAAVGPPEGRIIESAGAEMARFYKIPSRTLIGMTDANELDYQCGAESMLNFVHTARCGINVLTGLGSYANWMIASYEKLILDAQSVAYTERLLRPLDLSGDRSAVEVIQSVGPQGSYIMEEHTLDHYKEEFLETDIFDRQSYNNYVLDGKYTVHERVGKRIKQLLGEYRRPYVEASTKKQLFQYCESFGLGESIKGRFTD